ncbi:MAG: PAS domain S-box protein [Gemmatimonadaceae bacterium]
MTPRTAAAALHECEERYRAIFERHPLAMLVWEAETKRFLAVNDAAVAQYGYTRKELLGLTIWDIRPPEEVPNVRAIIERLPPGRHVFPGLRHRKKDGTVFIVDVVAHDVTWDGRPARLLLAADATERARAETALRESEDRYRLVVRASNDIVFDWDITTGQVHASGGSILGFADDLEIDFGWWAERVHPDDRARVEASLEAAIAGDAESWAEEYLFLRADGSYAALLDRGRILRDAGGRAVRMIGCMADLTERRRLEDQLRQSQKMEAVGRLAGGVAHDFNNVLTVVKSFSEFLLEDLDKLDPRRADVEEIAKAADRAAALTRKLLAFSRKQVMRPEPLDLNGVVTGMEKMLRRLIGDDVRIATALDPELLPVEADPSSIEQVILNLALNARDAMLDGGGTLTIRTKNETLERTDAAWAIRPGRYAMLSVSDTGHGMDAATRARAFEPFFTTKPQGQGTGLGLAMVYGIVKQSGGHVWVDSKPDEGTTFTIYLPQLSQLNASVAPRAGTRASGEPHPAHAGGGETILLVDDEDAVRSSARRALERAGYDVISATDGSDALRLFTEHDGGIHMVITDVVMPGLSGRELIGRLKIMSPSLPVLFVSGYTEEGVRRQGVLEPGAAYLEKPFTPEKLLRKVREVLDG